MGFESRNIPLTPEQKTLAERNLGFAGSVAARYSRSTGMPYDEAFQLACLGLCSAARLYDPSKGKFTTYAFAWCRVFILREYRENTIVHVPRHVTEVLSWVRAQPSGKTEEELIDEYEKTHTLRRHPRRKSLRVAMRTNYGTYEDFPTVDPPASHVDETGKYCPSMAQGLLDFMTSQFEDETEKTDWDLHCIDAIPRLYERAGLTDRERSVMEGRYGNEETLQEIGDRWGVSRERIRQIERSARGKLRAFIGCREKNRRSVSDMWADVL